MADEKQNKSGRRLLEMYFRFRAGDRLTVAQIVEEYEVRKPQAREDIKVLRDYIDLREIRQNKEKVYFLPLDTGDRRHLTRALTMAFGLSAMGLLRDTVYGDEAKHILIENQGSLDEHQSDHFQAVRRAFHVRQPEASTRHGRHEVVETILDAFCLRNTLQMTYERLHDLSVKEYEVDPLALVLHREQFQMVGRKRAEGWPIRNFDIDGILSCKRIRGTRFAPPKDFDIEGLYHHALGRYVHYVPETVVFSVGGPWLNYLQRRKVHPTQQNRLEGSRLIVELEVGVCPDLEAWLKSMIPHVHVLAPPSLRERIRDDIRDAHVHGGY